MKQDTSDESNELMYLVAAGVDGGANHRERGTGTILDDDPGSGVRLLVSDQTIVEGDAGSRKLLVPITLTQSATADVLVHYSTVSGSAMPGSDYTSKSGTIKIAKGKRQVTIAIRDRPRHDVGRHRDLLARRRLGAERHDRQGHRRRDHPRRRLR